MKRWLALGVFAFLAIIGWTVPRGTPPGGCITEYLSADSVLVMVSSCDPMVNDTLKWRGKSDHASCPMRFVVNIDARYMQIGRSIYCGAAPASANLRVALSPTPRP